MTHHKPDTETLSEVYKRTNSELQQIFLAGIFIGNLLCKSDLAPKIHFYIFLAQSLLFISLQT
jgi:uncharacterized membrane protein